MKRQALGKGLDAILPDYERDGAAMAVDVDLLEPNSRQPRVTFSAESLEELAESIRENGIVQPIVVRRKKGDRFEIVAGERRWRAAQRAGLLKVPTVVLEVSDDRLLELALLENIQREDLNPMEEARAYRQLLEERGYKQEDLARRLGKARPTIANSVRLLQLPKRVQDLLETRALTSGLARPLLGLTDAKLQVDVAEAAVKRGLSARDVERLVDRMKKASPGERDAVRPDPNVAAAEEKLSRHFQAKVRIEPGKRGGRVVFQYTSSDELDRLFEMFCGSE